MPLVQPAYERLIEIVTKEPERAKVVRGYPYRVASLRWQEDESEVDIKTVRGLWEWLSTSAGWDGRNNHSVFVFELEGQRYAVRFSDFTARFGREEDVFETKD